MRHIAHQRLDLRIADVWCIRSRRSVVFHTLMSPSVLVIKGLKRRDGRNGFLSAVNALTLARQIASGLVQLFGIAAQQMCSVRKAHDLLA